MHRNADPFADIMETEDHGGLGGGILNSQGLEDYTKVRKSVEPDGVAFHLKCLSCNAPRKATAEWGEVVLIGTNGQNLAPVLPPKWGISEEGKAATQIRCSCGRDGIYIEFTPDEARGYVKNGIDAGFINQQQILPIVNHANQVRGGIPRPPGYGR